MERKRKQLQKRMLAMVLCAAMLFSGLGTMGITAFATEPEAAENVNAAEGLCEHHPEHTPDCGYVEAVEGQPCNHVHDDQCGYTGDTRGGDICNHIHDENCGYVEAVQGSPCNYQCEICGKEEDVEETEETKEITILSFETLPEEVKKQKADVGTAQQDLNLPETLKAVTSEKEEAADIPVTWSASPEYDGEKDGTYRFTPTADRRICFEYGYCSAGDCSSGWNRKYSEEQRTSYADIFKRQAVYAGSVKRSSISYDIYTRE